MDDEVLNGYQKVGDKRRSILNVWDISALLVVVRRRHSYGTGLTT